MGGHVKVELDQDRCVSSGQCVLAAPEVFDQREEDGVAVLLDAAPAASAAEDVGHAAAVCPALAIRVEHVEHGGEAGEAGEGE